MCDMRLKLTAWLAFGAAVLLGQVHKTVTVTEATSMSLTLSPDHKTVVADVQGSLWAIPMSGGKGKRLTDPLLEPARPHYSPTGSVIAFEAYQGGTFHIWTMKPDGTALRQITDGHGDDREPSMSPDGTKIAFASDRAFKGSYDIWVVELATGKLTPWTSGAADEYEPAWSPDGTEIAFASGAGANATTIQAVKADGSVRTLMTASAGAHVNSPSWSPDGKQIAYTQFAAGKSELMVSGKRVGSFNDVFPFPAAWVAADRLLYAADGKIRVSSMGGETKEVPFEVQFTLDRPAYARKKFDLDSAASRPVKGIVSPSLSPDGKRVLFEAMNQLWVMDIGGKPKQLTNDKYYKEDPAWSPDGKRIAYSSDKAGTEDIYVLDLATTQEKRVTSAADSAEVSVAWSPNGKMLAFQDQAGATYTLEIETGKKRLLIPAQFAPSKPSWSAGGQSVSISALKPYTRRFREGTSQILTADVASGKLTYTEPAPFKSLSTRGEDGPIYSPDGSSVAFVMDSVLWVRPVDANGIPAGPAKQINHEVTDAPTWSGDSRTLLYLSNGKLRLIGADGSSPRTVPMDMSWHYEAAPERTVIYAGRLWDGRGAEVKTNVDITIENHRIRSIEPHRDAARAGAKFVDASNLTVIPGLWESHTHEYISGKFYGDRLGRLWLAYGVTELQSQGDPVYRAVETREAFGSGDRVGPRFFATGEAIDGERVYYNFMRPTMSDGQLELELSRAQALEYDNLKTYVRLPHAMQQKAMKFAHEKMGVWVASHYMLPGIAYGMDGMTHISATSRFGYAYTRSAGGVTYNDMISLFTAAGMWDISTPFMSFPLYADDPKMVDDARLAALNTPWDEMVLRAKRDIAMGQKPEHAPEGLRLLGSDNAVTIESLKKEEGTVKALLSAGGVVLAGTDSPLDSVATALHLNLRAQVKYGVAPWRALQTATLLPAKMFGVAKDLGTLEAGKLADLVLVAGDPTTDIGAIRRIRTTIKDGKLYDAAALYRELGVAPAP